MILKNMSAGSLISFIQYMVSEVGPTSETSSWHPIEVVCTLGRPLTLTRKGGYGY
jgi:hypothetical protein